jgi:hypothetical protein
MTIAARPHPSPEGDGLERVEVHRSLGVILEGSVR